MGLRGQGEGEKRQGLFRNVHAATQRDVRAEGLRVEGDVAGGKLFADALGQGRESRVRCDAEPEGRVGRAPKLSQTVGRKQNRGRASASCIKSVHGPTRLRVVDVAEKGQRQMVGASVEKAPV